MHYFELVRPVLVEMSASNTQDAVRDGTVHVIDIENDPKAYIDASGEPAELRIQIENASGEPIMNGNGEFVLFLNTTRRFLFEKCCFWF